jgi:hypothetical protein
MSRIQHRFPNVVRVGLAGAASVVLLAACSSNGGGSTGDALEAGNAEASSDDFCAQAADIDDRVDAALDDLEDGASVPDAFRQIADELRGIEAPDTIATSWISLADALDQMADAVADLDITDLDSLDALDDIDSRLTDAGDDVDTYLRDECGIDG